jgi:hypothetical protein
MTQSDLNRAVVRRTGESSRRIRRMGFTLLVPAAPIRLHSDVRQHRTEAVSQTEKPPVRIRG